MESFLATTTAHGLNRINVENRLGRFLWRFICVLLYGGCIIMIANVFRQVCTNLYHVAISIQYLADFKAVFTVAYCYDNDYTSPKWNKKETNHKFKKILNTFINH